MTAVLLATGAAPACENTHVVKAADPVQIGEAAEPAPTLTIDLGETEGSALGQAGLGVRLADVMVEGGSVTGFRIFMNAPDAGAETSVEAPSYVTSYSFFPAPVEGSSAGTFVVDLQPALARLSQENDAGGGNPLTLTLVPIGADDARIGLGSSEIVGQP